MLTVTFLFSLHQAFRRQHAAPPHFSGAVLQRGFRWPVLANPPPRLIAVSHQDDRSVEEIARAFDFNGARSFRSSLAHPQFVNGFPLFRVRHFRLGIRASSTS